MGRVCTILFGLLTLGCGRAEPPADEPPSGGKREPAPLSEDGTIVLDGDGAPVLLEPDGQLPVGVLRLFGTTAYDVASVPW